MDSQDFQQALKALQQEYIRALPNKFADIETLWHTLSDTWDADNFKTFIRLAHSLAGSGATYGFPDVGKAARALEQYCKTLAADAPLSPEERTKVERLLASLQDATKLAQEPPAPRDEPPAEKPQAPASPAPLILVYEPDGQVADDSRTQLGYYGYRAESIHALNDIPTLVQENVPAALVIDWDAVQQRESMEQDVLTQVHESSPALPIVFISEQDDLPARLEVVRHGATAYLVKPVGMGGLLETLDAQTGSRSTEPFRILIVEDDSSLAAWSSTVLVQASMVTQVVTDPMQVMPALIDFRPDLILTDVYMPGVSGLELAAVLRQQEAYLSIPIVFLSNESDVDKQLSAMRLGGDDFLSKPIEPSHLIASVTSRVQRARILRSLAEHDSLTGLLNHTRFKEQLVVEVARATRTQTDLSFVMLDIDRFKTVNDMHGHLTGDRVIKSLARLLKQRLRKSDILGRYGGEEFAIILPETDGGAAYSVMEEIRTAFAQIRQQAARVEFHVTFSAGIATCPPWTDPAELNEAADKQLYQAKRNGRNQISYDAG
jgi:diguanylate cyclase (GGDEF)-like protein